MVIMMFGLMLGILIAVFGDWQTGLVVGMVIVFAGFCLAAYNMWRGFQEFDREFAAADSDMDRVERKFKRYFP
jgi:hypothetical protein